MDDPSGIVAVRAVVEIGEIDLFRYDFRVTHPLFRARKSNSAIFGHMIAHGARYCERIPSISSASRNMDENIFGSSACHARIRMSSGSNERCQRTCNSFGALVSRVFDGEAGVESTVSYNLCVME